jgi:Flp pilus assembly protein CpaB
VNECVVAAASRSTVTVRSPVHWRLSAVTRTPLAETRYVQQVESSSLTGSHARPMVDEVVPVTETTGAGGRVVPTGNVTVTLLLFADSRPFASPALMTDEYVLPGIMSRVQV